MRRVCADEGCNRPARPDRTQCTWCSVGGHEAWKEKKRAERRVAAAREGREIGARARQSAQRRQERLRRRAIVDLGRGLGALLRARVAEESGLTLAGYRWRVRTPTELGFIQRVAGRLRRARGCSYTVIDDGTLTDDVLLALFAAGTECAYCLRSLPPGERGLDHVTPMFRGGAHSITNVLVCCPECNQHKWKRTLEEYLSRQPDALARVRARLAEQRVLLDKKNDAGVEDRDIHVGPSSQIFGFRSHRPRRDGVMAAGGRGD